MIGIYWVVEVYIIKVFSTTKSETSIHSTILAMM